MQLREGQGRIVIAFSEEALHEWLTRRPEKFSARQLIQLRIALHPRISRWFFAADPQVFAWNSGIITLVTEKILSFHLCT